MYATVPNAAPGLVKAKPTLTARSAGNGAGAESKESVATRLATPKSNTLAVPRRVRKMLAGLMSR